jgi:hypothetical protein
MDPEIRCAHAWGVEELELGDSAAIEVCINCGTIAYCSEPGTAARPLELPMSRNAGGANEPRTN